MCTNVNRAFQKDGDTGNDSSAPILKTNFEIVRNAFGVAPQPQTMMVYQYESMIRHAEGYISMYASNSGNLKQCTSEQLKRAKHPDLTFSIAFVDLIWVGKSFAGFEPTQAFYTIGSSKCAQNRTNIREVPSGRKSRKWKSDKSQKKFSLFCKRLLCDGSSVRRQGLCRLTPSRSRYHHGSWHS